MTRSPGIASFATRNLIGQLIKSSSEVSTSGANFFATRSPFSRWSANSFLSFSDIGPVDSYQATDVPSIFTGGLGVRSLFCLCSTGILARTSSRAVVCNAFGVASWPTKDSTCACRPLSWLKTAASTNLSLAFKDALADPTRTLLPIQATFECSAGSSHLSYEA